MSDVLNDLKRCHDPVKRGAGVGIDWGWKIRMSGNRNAQALESYVSENYYK